MAHEVKQGYDFFQIRALLSTLSFEAVVKYYQNRAPWS